MSVHKRTSNGAYFVSYRGADGKQTTKSFGKGREGKREAQKFDEEVKARKKVDAPIPTVFPGDVIHLDQLAQRFITAKKAEGRSPRWLKELAAVLEKNFFPEFCQKPADQLRLEEIVAVILKAYAHCGQITRSRYLSYMKVMFAWGVHMEYLAKNPLTRWRKPKERPRDTQLCVGDLQKIMAAAKPHLAWAIEVAWNLGVRTGESELLSLKWSNLDWAEGVVKVYAPKTKTTRTIPISPGFKARLKEQQEKAATDFLIEYQGKPLKKFRRSLKSACERAGITYGVVMYDIRHLYATTLLREGGDLSAVSLMMGHSTVKMTVDQYYHVLGDEKRRTIMKLPSLHPAAV